METYRREFDENPFKLHSPRLSEEGNYQSVAKAMPLAVKKWDNNQ